MNLKQGKSPGFDGLINEYVFEFLGFYITICSCTDNF